MKTLLQFFLLFLLTTLMGLSFSYAKNAKQNKVQEVNFDEASIKGDLRRPDGSYLVQKRGVDFMPLYNVRKQFDENIKDSVEYLK